MTSEKAHEHAHRILAEQHRELAEIARAGGWSIRVGADGPQWDAMTRQIHGVNDTFEPTVEDALSFYDPQARGIVVEALRACLADGRPFDFEAP